MGHTDVVNCLAKGGTTKTEEYFVSSSENGWVNDYLEYKWFIFSLFIWSKYIKWNEIMGNKWENMFGIC